MYWACMRAVTLVSSYPAKFSASITVTIASRDSAREVSRSRSRIWNARVAGKAEPLWVEVCARK